MIYLVDGFGDGDEFIGHDGEAGGAGFEDLGYGYSFGDGVGEGYGNGMYHDYGSGYGFGHTRSYPGFLVLRDCA
jgi:hypothetical protein